MQFSEGAGEAGKIREVVNACKSHGLACHAFMRESPEFADVVTERWDLKFVQRAMTTGQTGMLVHALLNRISAQAAIQTAASVGHGYLQLLSACVTMRGNSNLVEAPLRKHHIRTSRP